MKTLILIAHGSRRATSNAEVEALGEKLRRRVADRFDRVSCAFLEFAKPSIADGIDDAVQAGSDRIVLLPYFLACGTHVAEHIPTLVTAKQAEYPTVTIDLKAYIGTAPGMVELLASAV
jgi:sirohydrochlorin ferrochelatase